MSFSDFNLQPEFIKSIEAAGYESPTPLQSQLIPLLAEKKSAVVWTQSASGKTGAFLIPAMNYILENPAPEKRGARVLILTSRRDRVSQINYTIKRLSTNHIMRFGFIVSGRPYQTQMRLMRRPLDIMIATPGRLNDLMSNGKADFSQLEMLIIDDLTTIYKKNLHGLVEQIIKQAGDNCQTLTFISNDEDTNTYAEELFPNSEHIHIDDDNDSPAEQHNTDSYNNNSTERKHNNKQKTQPSHNQASSVPIPENIMSQKVHVADDYTHKIAMMDHLLDEFVNEPTLIYTATNKAAKMLQENLSNHGHAAELIDDLEADEIKDVDILIYSDQQKTKLDADIFPHIDTRIIHFDLPRKTDQFIKRVNNHQQERDNEALLMVDGYNYNELKHIEKTLGDALTQITVPGLEPLNPFVNQSKGRSPHKSSNNKQGNKKPQHNKSRNRNNRNNNKSRPNTKNKKQQRPKNKQNGEQQTEAQQRQRKGPFGRLNGGAQRKKNNGRNTNNRNANGNGRGNGRNVKVGVSTRGTAPPPGSGGDRGWQSDFANPQERKVERSKPVVIRYSKKRLLDDKPEET